MNWHKLFHWQTPWITFHHRNTLIQCLGKSVNPKNSTMIPTYCDLGKTAFAYRTPINLCTSTNFKVTKSLYIVAPVPFTAAQKLEVFEIWFLMKLLWMNMLKLYFCSWSLKSLGSLLQAKLDKWPFSFGGELSSLCLLFCQPGKLVVSLGGDFFFLWQKTDCWMGSSVRHSNLWASTAISWFVGVKMPSYTPLALNLSGNCISRSVKTFHWGPFCRLKGRCS